MPSPFFVFGRKRQRSSILDLFYLALTVGVDATYKLQTSGSPQALP